VKQLVRHAAERRPKALKATRAYDDRVRIPRGRCPGERLRRRALGQVGVQINAERLLPLELSQQLACPRLAVRKRSLVVGSTEEARRGSYALTTTRLPLSRRARSAA
jgi:hypothetical protein